MKGQLLIILAPLNSKETINILAIKMVCFFQFYIVSPVHMVTQYNPPHRCEVLDEFGIQEGRGS